MTWKEFKDAVEAAGVNDDTVIELELCRDQICYPEDLKITPTRDGFTLLH